MRGAFVRAIPPCRIADLIERKGAFSSAPQDGNLRRNEVYAWWLFLSFVFCESTVATSMSSGGGR